MTTMTGLAEFLLARIAEDEAVAVAARGQVISGYDDESRVFIQRFGSARVLAECDAKRRIVAIYLGTKDAHDKTTDPIKRLLGEMAVETLQDILKLLALPYADHSDYRSEWAS